MHFIIAKGSSNKKNKLNKAALFKKYKGQNKYQKIQNKTKKTEENEPSIKRDIQWNNTVNFPTHSRNGTITWKRIKNKDEKNSKTFKGIELPCHKISVYKEKEQERYFRKKIYLYSLI